MQNSHSRAPSIGLPGNLEAAHIGGTARVAGDKD